MKYLKPYEKYNMSVTQIAAKDIADYNRETNPETNNDGERWTISNAEVFSKKSKRLNKKLGLHKINKKDSIKNIKRFKSNEK